MKKVMKFLEDYLEEALMVILLAVISVVIFLQVIFRYCFKNALAWPEEFARYCFIYSAFLSFGYCIKHDRLLKVDVVVNFMSQKVQRIIAVFNQFVMLGLFCYLFYYSLDVVRTSFMSGQVSTAMEMPMYILYLCIPIGFGLGIIRNIQYLFNMLWKKGKKGGDLQ